jgi:hypothetical protein
MKFGVLEPLRFNERVENGVWTYDALIYIHYVGDEATATGLMDTPKRSWFRELINTLNANGVERFMYYSKGNKEIWRCVDGRWRLDHAER